ncbi:MAG: hypothetical protein LBQ06_05020 [Frankiaceae bacterium]|jgi:hypothetical protein|nr:hypothetical protein [Frankiaceae bacterium]
MTQRRCRRLMAPLRRDEGSAIIEFTFVAVLIMVPLVYLVVAVAAIQRTSAAAGDAARAAGRAIGSADTVEEGLARAQAAMRIVLGDGRLPADAGQLRIVPPSSACTDAQIAPSLGPGDEYAVCVIVTAAIPGVPSVLRGGRQTAVGRYLVHVDDYRR